MSLVSCIKGLNKVLNEDDIAQVKRYAEDYKNLDGLPAKEAAIKAAADVLAELQEYKEFIGKQIFSKGGPDITLVPEVVAGEPISERHNELEIRSSQQGIINYILDNTINAVEEINTFKSRAEQDSAMAEFVEAIIEAYSDYFDPDTQAYFRDKIEDPEWVRARVSEYINRTFKPAAPKWSTTVVQNAIHKTVVSSDEVIEAAGTSYERFKSVFAEALLTEIQTKLAGAKDDAEATAAYNQLLQNGELDPGIFGNQYFNGALAEANRQKAKNEASDKKEQWKAHLSEWHDEAIKDLDTDDVISLAFFQVGWDHAIGGGTASNIPTSLVKNDQELQFIKKGYNIAAGLMLKEGAPKPQGTAKMEGVGVLLKRMRDLKWDRNSITPEAEIIKAIAKVLSTVTRADSFPNMLAEGATPGSVRALEYIRSKQETPAEFLVNKLFRYNWRGWKNADLLASWVAQGSDEGVSTDITGRVREGWADRIDNLTEYLTEYVNKTNEYAAYFEGAKNVATVAAQYREAKKIIEEVDNNNANYYERTIIRHFQTNEDSVRTSGTRVTPLRRPRFDRVEREGLPDYRKGRNVTFEEVKEKFNIAGIRTGENVTSKQQKDHLNYAYDSLMDLAVTMGWDPKQIGFGGRLNIAIGKLGAGRHAAHFSNKHPVTDGKGNLTGELVPVIAITNTKGDGAVAHEYFHAIDYMMRNGEATKDNAINGYENVYVSHAVGRTQDINRFVVMMQMKFKPIEEMQKSIDGFLTGGRYWSVGKKRESALDGAKYTLSLMRQELRSIIKGSLSTRGQYATTRSKYYKEALKLDTGNMKDPYWSNKEELFARAGEAWVFDQLNKENKNNNYLVSDWVEDGVASPDKGYKGTPYPTGEEREEINKLYSSLKENIKFDERGFPYVDWKNHPLIIDAEALLLELDKLEAKMPKDQDEIDAAKAAAEKAKAEILAEEAALEAAALLEKLEEEKLPEGYPDELDNATDEDIDRLLDEVDEEEEAAEQERDDQSGKSPSTILIHAYYNRLKQGTKLEWRELFAMADGAYGGTQAEGIYTPKDAYDALEIALNQYLPTVIDVAYPRSKASLAEAKADLTVLLKIVDLLPTQTKRTEEQDTYQQFSTPPTIGYVMARVAGITEKDVVLEPSAGTGNLSTQASMFGARSVILNELSERRATLLEHVTTDKVYREDATHLNDILPKGEIPTVVLMNPPFSASAGKVSKNSNDVGRKHIVAAFNRLAEGGRMVILVGKGMAMDKAQASKFFGVLQKQAVIRANISLDGRAYTKFGTSFDNQLIVIDKISPETASKTAIITGEQGKLHSLEEALELLEGTKNERVNPGEQFTAQSGSQKTAERGSRSSDPVPTTTSDNGAGKLGDRSGLLGDTGNSRLPPGNTASGSNEDDQSAGTTSNKPKNDPAGSAGNNADVPPGDNLSSTEGGRELADILADAKKHGVSGSTNALTGLYKLFGGNKLNSFPPGFDETSYAEAKTYFAESWEDFKQAGNAIKEFYRFMRSNYGPGIKPMIRYWMVETRNGRKTKNGGVVSNPDPLVSTQDPINEDEISPPTDLRQPKTDKVPDVMTEAVFDQYEAAVGVKGSKPHPGTLVESAAMAAVDAPATDYVPDLPAKAIKSGAFSDAQIEPIIRAGAAHEQKLPDGKRKGYFVGDGTGLGKARIVIGVMLDNIAKGRKRHIWVTANAKLLDQARNEWESVTGKKADGLIKPIKGSANNEIKHDGVLFVTYGTLLQAAKEAGGDVIKTVPYTKSDYTYKPPHASSPGEQSGIDGQHTTMVHQVIDKTNGKIHTFDLARGSEPNADLYITARMEMDNLAGGKEVSKKAGKPGTRSRLDQITEWMGEDWDGVIAFDEAHAMANAVATAGARGTQPVTATARNGIALQDYSDNSRLLYVSATGATEVKNLGYATRLGLWGEGTAFTSVRDFVAKVSSRGVAAMELVAQNMKSLGMYTARSLSYHDVTYETLEHDLTEKDIEIYDTLAETWQIIQDDIQTALGLVGAQDDDGKNIGGVAATANSQFWGAHQRFFNNLLTAMQMPTLLRESKKQWKEGNAVVFQMVSTDAEQMKRAAARAARDNLPLDEIDTTPRDQLMMFLQNSFPVNKFEEQEDERGNITLVPVMSGGEPVQSIEALALRDKWLDKLSLLPIPNGALDQILNEYGYNEIAEVTGRTKRLSMDKKKWESRGEKATLADISSFMDDEKRALVFSSAGGTGADYHADLKRKNQRKRIHYLVQPGWRADIAVQGFGRTHRSNQKQAPHMVLMTTNLKGHLRFISSVARRLDQLGALTKGERKTGSQGMFKPEHNLETSYAAEAMLGLIMDLNKAGVPADIPASFSLATFEQELGISLRDKEGNVSTNKVPKITAFMNRLLSLKVERQNFVFGVFMSRLEQVIDYHKEIGDYDLGIETMQAVSTKKEVDQVVHTHEESGAVTRYVKLMTEHPVNVMKFSSFLEFAIATKKIQDVIYARNVRSGRIAAFVPTVDKTKSDGNVVKQLRRFGPIGNSPVERSTIVAYTNSSGASRLNDKWEQVDDKEVFAALWQEEYDSAPKTKITPEHVITGAILPIWDRLSSDRIKVVRAQTDEGERMIGLWVSPAEIDAVLQKLGADVKNNYTPIQIKKLIVDEGKTVTLANGWRLEMKKVSDQKRIEITMVDIYSWKQQFLDNNIILERIQYDTRAFIPVANITELAWVMKTSPVVSVSGDESNFAMTAEEMDEPFPTMSIDEVYGAVKEPINRINKKLGLDIKIVGNERSLPPSVLQEYRKQKAMSSLNQDLRPAAHVSGNRVFLVASNIKDAKDAEAMLAHEVVGHVGVNIIVGDAWTKLSNQIQLLKNSKDKTTSKLFEEVKYRYEGVDQVKFAQEFIAVAAEKRVTEGLVGKILRTVREAIKKWLFDLGFVTDFSMTDIDTILTQAEAVIKDNPDGIAYKGERKSNFSMNSFDPPLVRRMKQALLDSDRAENHGAPPPPPHSTGLTSTEDASIFSHVNRLFDPIRYQLQDKMIDTRRLHTEMNGTEDEDAWLAESIWQSKAGEILREFEEDRIDPLLEIGAQTNMDMSDMDNWLWARHAPEANAYLKTINENTEDNEALSGMTDARAAEIIAEHEDNSALQEYGRQIDVINAERVKLLVDEELIEQETADMWWTTYEKYVPLKRGETNSLLPARGQGFNIRGLESKRRLGSNKPVENVSANVIAQYEASVVRAEKNKVGQALLKFAQAHPDPSLWTVDKPLLKKVLKKGQVEVVPETQEADNELRVKVMGKEHTIRFNKDNVQAMRIVGAMKNLDQGNMNNLIQAGMFANRFLSAVNTSFSPEFVISNFTKDLQTAGYNMTSTKLKSSEMAVIKMVPGALKGLKRNIRNQDKTSEWGKRVERFRLAGGKTGWIDHYANVLKRQHKLEGVMKRLQAGKDKKALYEKVLDVVRDYNTVVENGIRLSAFTYAVEEIGMSDKAAASLAKELTVNFNRKGMAGPTLNAVYLFYNASIQGSVRMIQTMVRSKKGRALAAATMGIAVMLDIFNRSMSGDDDDDENIYDGMPDYVKAHNWIIMGEKEPIFKFPMPWGYNVFHVAGQQIGEALTGNRFKSTTSMMRIVSAMADSFNPIGHSTFLQTLSPTILDPFVQMGENKNWTGNPLMPHDVGFGPDTPASHRYFSSVRERSKQIAAFLNEYSGGDVIRPGAIDISPEWIDLFVDFAAGSAGRVAVDAADTVDKIMTGQEVALREFPMIRKVYGYDNQYALQSRYFEWSEDVQYTEKQIKNLTGRERDKAMALPQRKLILLEKSVRKNLTHLRKQRNYYKDAGDEIKAENYSELMRVQQARFNKKYAEVMFPGNN
jgi:hypothetical protein